MDFEEMDCRPYLVDGRFHGWICPKCFDHEHERPEGRKYYDCKNIIYHEGYEDYKTQDGRMIRRHSQCMCYSKEHGERETR